MLTTIKSSNNPLLTGKEAYKISGNMIHPTIVVEILKRYKNLNKYWDCLKKAIIARNIINIGEVVLGKMYVHDTDSNYGFEYNPPFEFHAWLQVTEDLIFDAALPGVIENGQSLSDKQGTFLQNLQPCILNGKPEDWMKYEKVVYYDENASYK